MTEATPAVLRAHSFELVDEHDQPRAVLRMEEGIPALSILDAAGNPTVSLFGDGDGASLVFWSADGEERLHLMASDANEGRASILLNGAAGLPAIWLDVTADGRTRVHIGDDEDRSALDLSGWAGWITEQVHRVDTLDGYLTVAMSLLGGLFNLPAVNEHPDDMSPAADMLRATGAALRKQIEEN